MAYDIEQMAIVWVPAHTNVPKGWSYINTDDTLAEIEANGYFDDEARLDLNDSIRVTGSDGTSWLRVSQAPPSEVQVVVDTNAVSSLLDGRFWVGNAANAATAVLMSGDATMDNTGAVTIANDAIETAMIADDAVTSDKVEEGLLKHAQVDVNLATFVGSYTASALLLAAPGANKKIVLHRATLWVDYGGTVLADGGAVHIQYDDTANAGGVAASGTIAAATLIAATADTTLGFSPVDTSLPDATTLNQGLYLATATQDFTGGDSSAYKVDLWYSVIDVS